MAKKSSSKSGKPWQPGDPLKLGKAIEQHVANRLVTDKPGHADDALISHVSNVNRSFKPTNHKPFSRQKKG